MLAFDLQRFAGEKTERATPRRRQEARQEGRIPKSAELTSAVTLVTVLVGLRILAPRMWGMWYNTIQYQLSNLSSEALTQGKLIETFDSSLWLVVKLLGPLLAMALVVGTATAFAQVGPLFLPNLLIPDFTRVSPLSGLRRIFSLRTGVEALKSLFKLLIIGTLAYVATQGDAVKLSGLMGADIQTIPGQVGNLLFGLAIQISLLFLGLAFLDFLFQRFEFERSIRMSREEIREESKQQEGDPLIRSRIRQRGRQMAMQRMMQNVPKADVIVTNPTHFSVALQYDAKKMSAPTVVAKGQDELAWRIRAIAQEHNVPLVENRPLAQALYRNVNVDELVPAEWFQAVAEVLAFVYRAKQQSEPRR